MVELESDSGRASTRLLVSVRVPFVFAAFWARRLSLDFFLLLNGETVESTATAEALPGAEGVDVSVDAEAARGAVRALPCVAGIPAL